MSKQVGEQNVISLLQQTTFGLFVKHYPTQYFCSLVIKNFGEAVSRPLACCARGQLPLPRATECECSVVIKRRSYGEQVRVMNDSCFVADDFSESIHECYDAYHTGVEDKKPFGLNNGTA